MGTTKDDQREKDIQIVAKAVLENAGDYYDNPNGAYETSCRFCGAEEHRGGGGEIWAEISKLKHKQYCPYLAAKDLTTGFN